MPDVDESTRILNKVCSDRYRMMSFSEKKSLVSKFVSIPDSQKPITFRKINSFRIASFFDELNNQIRSKISLELHCDVLSIKEDSNDNKDGSDLVAILSFSGTREVRRIELKFGSETNRNIGNNTMDLIFPIKKSGLTFSDLLKHLTVKQKEFVLSSQCKSFEEGYENLRVLINEFSSSLASLYDKKEIEIDSAVVEELLTTTGSLSNSSKTAALIKFRIDFNDNGDKGVKLIKQANVGGQWKFTKVGLAENAIRAEIIIENDFSSAKFLLNWKNNYKYNGREYPAKLGLGSTSWNVWLRS